MDGTERNGGFMKHQKMQLIVMLVVLLLVIVGVLWIRSFTREEEKKERESAETDWYTVTSFANENVKKITIRTENASIELSFEEQGKWIAGDGEVLDESEVETFLNSINHIQTEVQRSVTDLTEYGITDQSNQIRIEMKDGEEVNLVLGNQNEMLLKYYLQKNEEEEVYLVNSSVANAFSREIESFQVESQEQ